MEFGSDFHYIDPSRFSGDGLLSGLFPEAVLLGDGRQCLVALIRQFGWKRMWAPAYFCHEVMASVVSMTGIELAYYADHPLRECPTGQLAGLPYREGDFLLRMNYFGGRGFRSPADIPVPVVEDHSHDLTGPWAVNSRADWCIASLRKSLPIPDGGMIWSPKGLILKDVPPLSEAHKRAMDDRWKAMRIKSEYLAGGDVEKQAFRDLYIRTEAFFDHAEPSAICPETASYLASFDLRSWFARKRENWMGLMGRLDGRGIRFLRPEASDCLSFSLLPVARDEGQRREWKQKMIDAAIYPAILWEIPSDLQDDREDRILSLHCDGRYSPGEVELLAGRLEKILFA